jgi:hypothetical protein
MAEFVIRCKVRRWAWLRWPTATLVFDKNTTWEDAYAMAVQVADAGAWDVQVMRPVSEE